MRVLKKGGSMVGSKAVKVKDHIIEVLTDQVKAFFLHSERNGKPLKSFKQGNDVIRIKFLKKVHTNCARR